MVNKGHFVYYSYIFKLNSLVHCIGDNLAHLA